MSNKRINIITVAAVVLSIVVCLVFMVLPKDMSGGTLYSFDYPEKLFGTDMIEINIQTDEAAWRTMLDNATAESYIACDVTVNGTTFQSVGVRPKGNSSLSMVAGSDSDRFSFKLQFDEYIDGQTCFGLDKFVVNNLQADYTYMKEYFSYYLMDYMGVTSPEVSYAHITVNGEEWGLYLAVECYEDSFVQRTYQTLEGNLYSVKTAMGRGREEAGGAGAGAQNGAFGQGRAGWQGEGFTQGETKIQDGTQIQDETKVQDGTQIQDEGPAKGGAGMMRDGGFMPGMEMGGFGASNGGSLVYTDDNSKSYSSIFDNAVFKESGEEDYQRLIKALKKLSAGEELEKYFDVDQILRYFAVHTAVVNLDSYISNMQQNYYLYEKDGKVTILPWDYNLAFGGFQSGDASAAVNFPIDTPVSGVELSQRPLLGKLLEVPEYKERYHQYLQEIAGYLRDGQFVRQVREVDSLISGFVKQDATAFCTFDQYKSAVETFTQFCLLRAESIKGQLEGTIPSTTAEQKGSAALVAAEGINLSTMGSQGGARGGMAGAGGGMPGTGGGMGGIRGGRGGADNPAGAAGAGGAVEGSEGAGGGGAAGGAGNPAGAAGTGGAVEGSEGASGAGNPDGAAGIGGAAGGAAADTGNLSQGPAINDSGSGQSRSGAPNTENGGAPPDMEAGGPGFPQGSFNGDMPNPPEMPGGEGGNIGVPGEFQRPDNGGGNFGNPGEAGNWNSQGQRTRDNGGILWIGASIAVLAAGTGAASRYKRR